MKYQEVANKVAKENGWDFARFEESKGGREIYVCVSKSEEAMRKECGGVPCTGLPDKVYVTSGYGRLVLGSEYLRS